MATPFIPIPQGANLGFNTNQQNQNTSFGASPASSTAPLPSLGQTAKAPTLSAPSNAISSNMANPVDTNYFLKPGESINDYNARISSYNTSKSQSSPPPPPPPATPTPQSTTQPTNTNPYTATPPAYGGIIGSLATTASQPSPQFTQAYQDYLNAKNALQQSQAAEYGPEGALPKLAQTPIPLEFQQGRGAVLQQAFQAQQQQYAQSMAGAASVLGAATSQQQAQQQGLGAAAGLTAPQQVTPTNVPFNPVTGTYGSPAATAFGAGTGLQNIGNIEGQINVGQNVAQLNSYLGGAQVVGKNLNDLISSANINPQPITYVNGLLQFGADVMSNPQYRQFAGQLNDFVASLAPILGVGGNVTDMKTQMSNQIVNGLQSGQTIQQVVNYFLDQAKQKIIGLSAGGGAGVGTANTNPTTGLTFGSNIFQ